MENNNIENQTCTSTAEDEKGLSSSGGGNNKKSLKWLWIAISLLLVGAIAAWCIVNALKVENGLKEVFNISKVVVLLAGSFIVSLRGYLLGSITIKGVSLGTACVFLVAILFGYLCTLPGIKDLPILGEFYMADSNAVINGYYKSIVQNIGLVLFVAAVGFIAGPSFFRNLKKNATSYVLLGVIIILSAGIVVPSSSIRI